MADQTTNASILFVTGSQERVALYAVKGVTTADTVSVSAQFSKVKAVANVFAGSVTGNTVPTVSGTTVTIAQAGLSGDTVYLLVVGDA